MADLVRAVFLIVIQTLGATDLIDSLPSSLFPPYSPQKTCLCDGDGDETLTSPSNAAETGVIESIYDDDKSSLIAHSKRLLEQHSEPLDRNITSKLLQLCCAFDSAGCAAALIAGEVGEVPLVNEADETGRTPLHAAAEYHSARCVELLLRKRARTEVRTRDGRGLLALEVSLSSSRFDVDHGVWNPCDYSIEDLVVLLGEKDLTTIRLISEKTKEVAKIACARALEGSIVALAALLVVAADKINDSTLEFDDADPDSKETTTTTVYECVVTEALSLGRQTTTRVSSSSSSLETPNDTSPGEKRKLLVAGIELLQLFGVVSRCPDKNVKSPLVRAVLAGDEVVVSLLLKANLDINEADVEGNTALHYSLKASKAFSSIEIKILGILLEHGARVGQKNKLGLTALHMAAGNGHFQALQIILMEDPEGINYKTEMKETPLFFAVKNDHMDCAEFLLRWGANSEVLNIRQRPVDLAKSQDMRYMLNPTNIGLMNRNFPGQQRYVTRLLDEEENCETLLMTTDEDTSSERGAKCFYAHSAEEHRTFKHSTHQNRRYTSAPELKRKIFVGGLPISLDSASLRKYFEENFGPVEDARVLVSQTGNHIQSRGFGFVTFKEEKYVSAAIQAHYVFIMDKQVEIKSVVAKWVDPQEPSTQQESEGKSDRPQAQASSEAQGQQTHTSFEGQQTPTWLRIFKKWLPCFLRDMLKDGREGQYALSSLKGDFRSKFGLELDHASLGYSKLSDFMKCFSDICCTSVLPIGRGGSANHMVLLPKSLRTQQLLRRLSTIESIMGGCENHLNDSTCTLKDHTPKSCENAGWDCSQIKRAILPSELDVVKMSEAMSSDAQPMFMQLLEQDPLFHIRPWLQNDLEGCIEEEAGQNSVSLRRQHLVLEALARSRKHPSFYFLREFDFYSNYIEGVKEGKCFACEERKVLWANFPCQHLLWCIDCKTQASLAAGSYGHKCVVCDIEVQRIDLLTHHDYRQLVGQYIFHEEFPPLDPNHIRSPSTKLMN